MELVAKLKELKGERSYQEYADFLGIHKSHVFACLNKGRPMGAKFLGAVMSKYPELTELVLDYIQRRNNGNSTTVTT